MQAGAESADAGSAAYAAGGQSWFTPGVWPLVSLLIWGVYVTLKGWHTLGLWERRHVAFGILSALLFINYLSVSPDFQGWADVYYFCGSKLQYCNCNFKWNLRGWMKAYVLWSFILSSASGLQKLVIQLGLNGLLPGEEVVTRESVVSICWRLIPYWLNNWEQQWGAECSSMMFELPHFAVELLVVLPCIQILCARLKILAMPLVYLGPAAQQQRLAEHHNAAHAQQMPGNNNQQQDAQAADNEEQAHHAGGQEGGAAGQQEANNARQARRGHRHRGVVRQEFAPNILRGYWERAPEQQKLLPRLRANMQVMLFTVFITALAATNALIVPLWLESTVTSLPSTHVIRQAGLHPQWFTDDSQLYFNERNMDGTHILPEWQIELLTTRLESFQQPRPSIFGRSASKTVIAKPTERQLRKDVAWARYLSHIKLVPLARAIRQQSLSGIVNFFLCKELTDTLRSGWKPSKEEVAQVLQRKYPGSEDADKPITTGPFNPETMSVNKYFVPRETKGACYGKMNRFRGNLAKHAQEISKMQAPVHRALIPLVESALAVMRLACEKFFLLLAILVSNLLFRDNPPRPVRMFIRAVAKLSTIFQKVILYSFPAVCWLYGAGLLFSMFVSIVFWGSPLLALYDTLRTSASTVRVKNLRHATEAELERMAGNCAICWGEMHVGVHPISSSNQHDSSEQHNHKTSTPDETSTAAVADQAAQQGASGACNGSVQAVPGKQEEQLANGSGSGGISTSASSTIDSKSSSHGCGVEDNSNGVAGSEQQPAIQTDANHHIEAEAANVTQDTAALPQAATAVRQSLDGQAAAQTGALNEDHRAWSLPCGHAYHHVCLSEWLKQCHSNSVPPTCPMCQARIQLEVRYRFPFPLKRQATRNGLPDVAAHVDANEAAANLERQVGLAVGLGPNAFGNADGADSSDDEDEEAENRHNQAGDAGGAAAAAADDGEEELGVVMMPVMNPAGLGRQRQGRVRNVGPLRPHENLLLPPPMAALGNMHMLRLLDFHRELQEMLQDMPQIPPPEDVALLQLVAQQQQQQAGQLPFVMDVPAAADVQANMPHAPQPLQQQPQQPEDAPALLDNTQQQQTQSQHEAETVNGDGSQLGPTYLETAGDGDQCGSERNGTLTGQLVARQLRTEQWPQCSTSTQSDPGASGTSSLQASVSVTGLRHRGEPSSVKASSQTSPFVQAPQPQGLANAPHPSSSSGMLPERPEGQHAELSYDRTPQQANLIVKDGNGSLQASALRMEGLEQQFQETEAFLKASSAAVQEVGQLPGTGTASSPLPEAFTQDMKNKRKLNKELCGLQRATSAQASLGIGNVSGITSPTMSTAAATPVVPVTPDESLAAVASTSNGITTAATSLASPPQADEPQQRRRFLFFHRCKGNNP